MDDRNQGNHQSRNTYLHEIELQESPITREHSNYMSMQETRISPNTTGEDRDFAISPQDAEPAKPPMVWERPDYSDLEVCAVIPPTWDNDKMPVVLESDEKMESRNGVGGTPLSPYLTDPVPAYSAQSHRTSAQSQAPLAKGDYSDWEHQATTTAKGDRRILGFAMSKKRLSVVGVGILAFILILLATVLGITLTMNIVSRQRDKSSSSLGDNILLDNSGLAAVNWTDSSGTERSAVFYQDASNSVMVSLRDSVSNEWTQSNVTAAIMNNTGASRLDVLPGTPLAAVTNRYQVSLYYLTTANSVAEIWASDIVGEVWFAGALQTSLSPLTAMNGSHLSAYWQICNNCSNSLYMLFQDGGGDLQMANLTNGAWSFASLNSSSSVNGTGLAVRPFTEDNGVGTFGTDPGALRMYSFDDAGLLEFKDGSSTNFTWEVDSASTAFIDTLEVDTNPELAAISYGQHGLTNMLVNYLAPGGSINSYVYNGSAWTSGQPNLTGGPTNFSAIATAQNMLVYGSFNGSIYEYEVDNTNPLKWTEKSTVFAS
ncbi:hypothetical protein N0V93_010200 [Gnomoniopsis smithogilvyi]|uniref:Fucose-specific lectin n=1 Tax=Gnomoniopsis smithogilvyi TaxID=1191159 RepID=A0A9W8YJX3_9PEZI|nr:hypothetical protein N0V93_010200 [Gnomoniopsis smithogilvyi]